MSKKNIKESHMQFGFRKIQRSKDKQSAKDRMRYIKNNNSELLLPSDDFGPPVLGGDFLKETAE